MFNYIWINVYRALRLIGSFNDSINVINDFPKTQRIDIPPCIIKMSFNQEKISSTFSAINTNRAVFNTLLRWMKITLL